MRNVPIPLQDELSVSPQGIGPTIAASTAATIVGPTRWYNCKECLLRFSSSKLPM